MSTATRLQIEALKKAAKFNLSLPAEQIDSLVQQCKPFLDTIESLSNDIKRIRNDSRLSDSAKANDIAVARQRAIEKTTSFMFSISRQGVIEDLAKRLAGKTTNKREENHKSQTNSDSLSRELRESVLPKLIAEGEKKKIDKIQTVSKLALEVAERYNENPSKMETILKSLSIGWPFAVDLPQEIAQQVDAMVAAQVAPDEVEQLKRAHGVEQELRRVAESCLADIKAEG